MNLKDSPLTWTVEISLLNNRFILLNVIKAIGLTLLILLSVFGTLFYFQGGIAGLMTALIPCLMLGGFFLVVSVLTLGVVLRNRYPLEFILSDDGIYMHSKSSSAKKAHRLALILGILARSSSAAGAGALGISGESFFCAWRDIKKLDLYPNLRVIAAKQNAIQTMYVFCTTENYSQVAELISSMASQTH